MMDIYKLFLFSIATWRISALVTKEAGPFHVFEKLRILAGVQHDADGNVVMVPEKFFAELLTCIWCSSIWIGAILFFLWLLIPAYMLSLCFILFMSAVAIVIDKFV